MLTWLRKQEITLDHLLVCMGNTGIYPRALVDFLQRKHVFVWVENPVAIKWSLGLQRGKTDQIDSQRICLYAFRKQAKAKACSPQAQSIQKVSELIAVREGLIKAGQMLLVPIEVLKDVGLQEEEKLVRKSCQQTL